MRATTGYIVRIWRFGQDWSGIGWALTLHRRDGRLRWDATTPSGHGAGNYRTPWGALRAARRYARESRP